MTLPQQAGRLIVINGTSSAGKTTLCAALQTLLDEPYMVFGYDRMWMSMPARYGPFQPQEREGVWYDLHPENPTVATGIGFGRVGRQAVRGLHHAVTALLACGLNVIVDVLFAEPAWYDEARKLWQPYQPLWVALKPPLAVSERWEAEREATRAGRPTGLARIGRHEIYAHGQFDLELDPSLGTPEDTARTIIAHLNSTSAE